MKSKKLDYIDFKEVNSLLEGFNKTTGFVTAILDLEGNVLSKSGWRSICVRFHRVNHETSKNCSISDTVLSNELSKGEKYHFYKCLNGLVDVAVPIIINGEHVANLFSGQFFFEKPDREFFIDQARKYGFDEKEYLEALDNVPVVSKEKVKTAMDFLLNMTLLISEITFKRLEQTELNEAMKKNVEERRRQEGQLFESEFRFNRLYEDGPFGMVMADSEFMFKKINPAFCSILGYSEEELRKLSFKDVTHPDDLTKDLINVKKPYNKEISVYKTEKRYIRKDGQVIWGSLTVTPTYDKEGRFLYYLGVIEDITRRKTAEEEIELLNERISTATRASRVGIWDWDVKNNVLVWDDQMYMLYGLKKSDYSGTFEAWIKGIDPAAREFCQNETNLALSGVKDYDTEFPVLWQDGTIHYIKARGEVFRDETGNPVRMVGINYDITEQKKIYDKIREKDEEFRKLSANVPDLIFQFTRRPDGSYFVPIASEGIRNIFGCNPEDVLDDFTPIARVIYPMDADRVIREIEHSAEHLNHFTCEFRVSIPGKDIQWIYSNSSPEKLPDGSVTWYGFNVDITQKKLAEEALRELNETLETRVEERTSQLREANRELDAFSYSVSHDLRSPLRHINGFADILAKQYSDQLTGEGKKYLNIITDSAKKMGTLIDDLLSFSRTGRTELKKSDLNMNLVLDDALGQLKPLLADRKIEWQISQLPVVQGDYSLIRLVWSNLLDNAIKYTRYKTKAVINIGFREEETETVFFIKDNGAGFDMKYAQKLFGVFQRMHSSSEFDGTGIGLANVRRIITRHGGRTWADAQTDIGATFYFSIPKQTDDNQ